MTTLNLYERWNDIGNDNLNGLTTEEIGEIRAQALRWTFWFVLAAGVIAAVWWN